MKVRSLLGYGVLLKEIISLGAEENDWTDFISSKYGLKRPTGKFTDKYKEYWKQKDGLLKDLNISVEPYGNYKEYKCFLCIKDSLNFCVNGFETCLSRTDLELNHKWNLLLTQILEKTELKADSLPNWYLLNYYEN